MRILEIIKLVLLLIIVGLLVSFIIDFVPGRERSETHNYNKVMEELKNPQDVIDFLNENFKFSRKDGNLADDPQEFLEKGVGGEQDFAAFAALAISRNDFPAYVYVYEYLDQGRRKTGFVTLFRRDVEPEYIYFTEEGVHSLYYGWNLSDIYKREEERLDVEVVRYGTVDPPNLELIPVAWYNVE